MLIYPMRSPSSSPARRRDPSPYSLRSQREETPQTAELRKQVASTMLATLSPMPVPTAPGHRRPKLSLQTSLSSIPPSTSRHLFTPDTNSPTSQNTHRNALATVDTPPTPLSTLQTSVETNPLQDTPLIKPSPSPPHSNLATLNATAHPIPSRDPYQLTAGRQSALRNSPLLARRRIFESSSSNNGSHSRSTSLSLSISSSTTVSSSPRPTAVNKRVTFAESAPEIMPVPIIEVSPLQDAFGDVGAAPDRSITATATASVTDLPPIDSEAARKERRAAIQEQDGHTTSSRSSPRRRKRAREWIWRPVEEEEQDDDEDDKAIRAKAGVAEQNNIAEAERTVEGRRRRRSEGETDTEGAALEAENGVPHHPGPHTPTVTTATTTLLEDDAPSRRLSPPRRRLQ